MLRNSLIALALMPTPALSAGIEITVKGAHTEGVIAIDLLEDIAPNHAARITELAEAGFYDGVYFHRVIDGFMAQTGDGQFAKVGTELTRPGTGGSELPNVAAEISGTHFGRGVVGMARSQAMDSANSQFFIMFDDGLFLNGKYTAIGRVTSGFEVLDNIKRGDPSTYQITGTPDYMEKVVVTE